MQALAKMAGMRAADSPDLADKDQLHAEAERGPIPFARKGEALFFAELRLFWDLVAPRLIEYPPLTTPGLRACSAVHHEAVRKVPDLERDSAHREPSR